MLTQQKVNIISTYFSEQPVLKAYLFGSQVRHDATPKSDIDLLVELDYSQNIGLAFMQMKIDLEILLAQKVDIISARGLSKYLQPTIDQEKQLIYAR